MARGLDHIVHVVRDLDAAAKLYRGLGFTVGARNRHSREWGTQNHIVQLSGTFIEVLTVADPDYIAPHAPNYFSFGAFNRDALARGEGLSMLVVEGHGAADAEAFRASGIGNFQPYDFEREGRRPDGTAIKVAFSLAFARDPKAPDVGYFSCQHRFPENFWNPAFQNHRNTASNVAGIVLAADHPADHRDFLTAFCGVPESVATATGAAIVTPRGDVEVMTPAAFADCYGVDAPDTTRGARLAAVRFGVRDMDALRSALRAAGVMGNERAEGMVVGPASAMGATLVFQPLGQGSRG